MSARAGANILVTGGIGSFGHAFVAMTLAAHNPRRGVVCSRDEMKQAALARLFADDPHVRFFIGNVRDRSATAIAEMIEAHLVEHPDGREIAREFLRGNRRTACG